MQSTLYKHSNSNRKEVPMQKRIREKSVSRVKWYAVLLLAVAAFGIIGCQQPAKTPVKDVNQEKAQKPQGETPAKPEKAKTGKDNADKPKEKEAEKQPEKPQQNQQGSITYQGLALPVTLARSPQELRERIIAETKGTESDPMFNSKGQIVKYVEKEVEYDISAAFDDNLLLDPAQNSIYPGAVLAGESIDDGSYREITNGNKRKATISFGLQGVKDKEGKDGKAGITSGEIIPNLAAYRDLHNKVLSQNITNHASAHYSYTEQEIKSEESFDTQFKVGVGFAAAGIKSKIAAGFKFKKGDNKNRHLIKFVETFYTADVNQENVPLMIDIPRDVVGNRMPVYVSSVSYGRIAYLTIESEKTWSELKPSFEAVLKASTTNNAELDISNAMKNLEEGTNITINIIGGSSEAVTDLKQFQKYIVKGGFSSGNPGQVIKYRLRFLDDNATAHIRYAGRYKTVERTEIPTKGYKVIATVKEIKCSGFHQAEVTGTIGIQPSDKEKLRTTVFQAKDTAPVTVTTGSGTKPFGQFGSIIVPTTSVTPQLYFDIQGKITDKSYTFVTDKRGDNPLFPLRDAGSLKTSRRQAVSLYCKGEPNKRLEFDIEFTVQEEQ